MKTRILMFLCVHYLCFNILTLTDSLLHDNRTLTSGSLRIATVTEEMSSRSRVKQKDHTCRRSRHRTRQRAALMTSSLLSWWPPALDALKTESHNVATTVRQTTTTTVRRRRSIAAGWPGHRRASPCGVVDRRERTPPPGSQTRCRYVTDRTCRET